MKNKLITHQILIRKNLQRDGRLSAKCLAGSSGNTTLVLKLVFFWRKNGVQGKFEKKIIWLE
jgi:hypothetical protein